MKNFCLRLCIGAIVLSLLPHTAHAAQTLIPVGQVVGLELQNDTVTVAALEDNSLAKAAGLLVGDRLLRIDGHPITCAEDVRSALDRSDGTVEITVMRGKELSTVRLSPDITANGPKLGVYLRQGVTGIGTVTYYDPQDNSFGVLGHGVNDPSGQLLQLTAGNAYPARIVSVRKGRSGEPGQLMGALTSQEPLGSLYRNTTSGVFGKASTPMRATALPVGSFRDIETGPATILSTITGASAQEYSVEILKIYPSARSGGRNMLIKVTDPILLETTGGIVQGMGVSYNRDNPEKPLACRVIWGWSQFLLDFANYRIPRAGMLGHYHSMPLIKAEDEIYEGGLSTRHFNTTSNFPFSCHTG